MCQRVLVNLMNVYQLPLPLPLSLSCRWFDGLIDIRAVATLDGGMRHEANCRRSTGCNRLRQAGSECEWKRDGSTVLRVGQREKS